MDRVRCTKCREIGYTAAPERLVCKCGGRFRIIPRKREDMITAVDTSITDPFNLINLLNYGNN